ncbi:sugar phosphate isomerase/epimerase family protein [Aquimarina pacifica]|uniref:sugar phosphate isomerase/epimerase family protein n=1 Tax=Aquimarina pacifica TaxID=1296415 RepID=UPI00046ED0CF|nr:sugar phosphate isomerase/epimerase family protein [Aquimarina pacifica]
MYSRRKFVKHSVLGAIGSIPLASSASSILTNTISDIKELELFVFSKHLQFLNYKDMSEAAREIGFDGIDLTVRPKGHVLPEKVADDLPKATEAMKSFGFKNQMITTSIKNANNPIDSNILEVASQQQFMYYRMGWLKYAKSKNIIESVNVFKDQVKKLAHLNQELGIKGTYQNHAGYYMGSSIWDLDQVLEGISKDHMGCQYDITHATVEGGRNWELGFELIKDHINSLVIKDFKWEKVNGKWKSVYAPIGEGMVDFKKFFSLLKKHKIQVPISMHFEYPLGGAEKGKETISVDQKVVFDAMKKDIETLKTYWAEA